MKIKAQGLLNAAKWVEETHGRDALAQVLDACPDHVREQYVVAINLNWHPVEEFVAFIAAAERVLGDRTGKIAEEFGAAGAESNMRGMLPRIALYLARPQFLMERAAKIWRQFNDEGAMDLLHIDERSAVLELRGVEGLDVLFCAVLTGWCRTIATRVSTQEAVARHVECMGRGDRRCIWEVRWRPLPAAPESKR